MVDLGSFWGTTKLQRFTVCSLQWPLSKLSAVSASRAGRKSSALLGWPVRSWRATQRLMTSLRFRTPTSSWPRPWVTLHRISINTNTTKQYGRANMRMKNKNLKFYLNTKCCIYLCQEKWDSMTRKWKDNCLLQLVRLFLIDEVSEFVHRHHSIS